jgi:hypothetical protein
MSERDLSFQKARETIIKSYDERQKALGAQLLGLIAGLFTLLQTVQNSAEMPLSEVFSGLVVRKIRLTPFAIFNLEFWRWFLFVAAIFVLLFLITRTIFRFALFSRYSEIIYNVDYTRFGKPTESNPQPDYLFEIREVVNKMIEGKISRRREDPPREKSENFLLLIPHVWFMHGRDGENEIKGYILSAILAGCFTRILLFLLW